MWETKSGNAMFQEIVKFKNEREITGYSIMEVVLMYCEELDEDIDEVGELLKKDKNFRETLKEDLKFHNQATFGEEKKQSKMSEWL